MELIATMKAGTMAAHIPTTYDEVKALQNEHGELWILALWNDAQHDERREKIVYETII